MFVRRENYVNRAWGISALIPSICFSLFYFELIVFDKWWKGCCCVNMPKANYISALARGDIVSERTFNFV